MTATNGIVKAMNAPDKDTMIVPIQRLSKCHQAFPPEVIPWTGHGKAWKYRVIRRRIQRNSKSDSGDGINKDSPTSANQQMTLEVPKNTRSGRKVTLPWRYQENNVSCPKGPPDSGGGGCKGGSRERRRADVT